MRRGAQLARKYPNLIVQDIRGNLNTRLAKLDADGSRFAGIILAQAGLERMGWRQRINQTLDCDDILYAVGQGALAVECRANDAIVLAMLRRLSCFRTQCRILTERSFLKTLGGGCSAPVAVITDLKRTIGTDDDDKDYELHITGAVWSLDGTIEVQSKQKCLVNLQEYGEDDDDEVIPMKRAKLDETTTRTPPKSKSPTIVDDSLAAGPSSSSLATGGPYDIKALIDIHGELFKKCPYAVHHQAANDADKCPLNLAVAGTDVMGQCPYFNADQKVSIGGDVPSVVAPSGKIVVPDGKLSIESCPFVKSVEKKGVNVTTTTTTTALPITECPFMAAKKDNTFVMVDAEESRKSAEAAAQMDANKAGGDGSVGDEPKQCTIPLHCGLFRHRCYKLNVFEKCEELGRSLAKNLIANGAMTVMEKAQLEIRKNV